MRERSAGGGRAEDFTIAASETLDALCVQQGFGCRQQGEAVDSARCPLVCRIEAADTLDFVAEEIEPQRLFLARREKVYDPAAHSELARVGHCFHTHIAVGLQKLGRFIDRNDLEWKRVEKGKRGAE